MSSLHPTDQGRRKFLRDALRTSLVGAFALTGILLGSRKGSLSSWKTACPPGLNCRDCGGLRGCIEPRADVARREAAELRLSLAGIRKGDGLDR